MTNREQSVLDEIDALVDEQLQQTRSGYDHNINQHRCRICGGDTHTLPITERMQQMRRLHWLTVGYYEGEARVSQRVVDELNAYRYDEDDSRIVCPGSDFIGPMPAPLIPPGLSLHDMLHQAIQMSGDLIATVLHAPPDDPLDASDWLGTRHEQPPVEPGPPRVRLWDADWNCVYDSDNDTRNHWDVIGERGDERTNYSIDRAGGREHGHVATGSGGGSHFVRDDVPPEVQNPRRLAVPLDGQVLIAPVGESDLAGFTPVGMITRGGLEVRVDPDLEDRFRRMSAAMQRFAEAISDIGLQFAQTTLARAVPGNETPRQRTTAGTPVHRVGRRPAAGCVGFDPGGRRA